MTNQTATPAMFAKIRKAYIPTDDLRATILWLEERELLPRPYDYGEDWLLESFDEGAGVLDWLSGTVECRGANALKVAWLVASLLEDQEG